MIWRLRSENKRWRAYPRMLIAENRWRAQRYGLDEGLVDFGKGAIIPYPDLLEEIIGMVGEDSNRLGCRTEIEAARGIVSRGTSAHRQIAAYQEALASGATPADALRAVVDELIAETADGLT